MPDPNAPKCRLIWARAAEVGELLLDSDMAVLGRSRH